MEVNTSVRGYPQAEQDNMKRLLKTTSQESGSFPIDIPYNSIRPK